MASPSSLSRHESVSTLTKESAGAAQERGHRDSEDSEVFGRVPGPIRHQQFGRRRPEQESGLSAELLRTRPKPSACLGVSVAAFLGHSVTRRSADCDMR